MELNGSAVTQTYVVYEYDAFGNLVKESVTPYSGGVAGSATTTEYAVDAWAGGNAGMQTWAVLNGSNALQTREILGVNADQIYARIDNASNEASDPTGLYFTLTDRLGSVRDVLDSTPNDAPVDVVVYNAWGTIMSQTSAAYLRLFAWNGYLTDATTTFCIVNGRTYDAQAQRWLQQNSLAGAYNAYAFLLNNPSKEQAVYSPGEQNFETLLADYNARRNGQQHTLILPPLPSAQATPPPTKLLDPAAATYNPNPPAPTILDRVADTTRSFAPLASVALGNEAQRGQNWNQERDRLADNGDN